jgi:hypothetical protein
MPPDSPSMLSSRLNALVIPTNQTTDTSASRGEIPVRRTSGIRNVTTAAMIVWTTSFVLALKCSTSSSAPRPNIEAAPISNGRIGISGVTAAVLSANAAAIA